MTKLETAISEAKRFLERAEAQQAWVEANSDLKDHQYPFDPEHRRLNAATKRASMDLTKALPALRRSQCQPLSPCSSSASSTSLG